MSNRKFLPSILIALCASVTYSAERSSTWITDWSELSEVAHSAKSVTIQGVVQSPTSQFYSIRIDTKTIRSEQLKKDTAQKYFGLNRRGADALNTQITSLEFTVADRRMAVPIGALNDILNPMLGERMQTVFSRGKRDVDALIINGADGAEGYIVAFIFENGRFSRRQVRANVASPNGWPLLEDKTY